MIAFPISFSKHHMLIGQPTELPDSLDDSAEIAAEATARFAELVAGSSSSARCRVDFDTSVGDETYTLLKSSSDFMQKFTTALCYAMIPGVQDMRMQELKNLSQAKANLRELGEPKDDDTEEIQRMRQEYIQIIRSDGRADPSRQQPQLYDGPVARIYFPDEGSAALARRDWAGNHLVPPCVQFSSCGGVQVQNVANDVLVLFFCPKASESESVEKLLLTTEQTAPNLKLTVFVNPKLVDMGVTGFGMAGRLLRERLIDPLVYTYYLRTLPWGALTRVWPRSFSVWQEDETATEAGGYRLIASLDRLPSNPEVEDIYDVENGLAQGKGAGGGFLDQFGDFVNGMMRL